MERTFSEKTGTLLSIIGAIVSLISFIVHDISSYLNINYVLLALLVIFAILTVVFWRENIIKRRYVEGSEYLKKLHQDIISLQSRIKSLDEEKFSLPLHQICHNISKIFSNLRDKQIFACIKYINVNSHGEYYVQSLCRDADSFERNNLVPIKSDKDYIHKNSDFSLIINDIADNVSRENIFFFSNNLPNEYGYQNSHLNERKLRSWFDRYRCWPLPYKSTIIVPILSASKQTKDSTLYAFLCIDCKHLGAFDKTRDIVILQTIALQLLPIIEYICNKYLAKNERNKEK